MSSYYPSFSYMGLNSLKDKKLIVVHFDGGDNGEMETFLGMDSVYTETAYRTHRHDYGAKYNDVAKPKISVMKINGKDFTVAEVRDFLKWTTGVRNVSYLDILANNTVRCSFLGRVINILQHKLDARTIGFTIEFESTNPWAWSPQQFVNASFEQKIVVDNDIITKNDSTLFNIDDNGVLSNNDTLSIDNSGTLYIDNSTIIEINNLSDDLYTYVNLDVTFTNNNSDYLSIKNTTLNEETIIKGMAVNEKIKLHSGQFITSDIPYKLFSNNFNFVWPRLAPGINQFVIDGTGSGSIEFTYRYPIKIGDMAINVSVSGNDIEYGDCVGGGDDTSVFGQVDWNDIVNTPTTLDGYGITDAYTTVEVDEKIEDINLDIDETELEGMLTDVLDD